ncbi:MAG: BolA family transcriptional regulator [Bdellovibrionales bacterium]|nr:BolA family transcriptional regulator [Bdellovibrionales bacterium]
MEPIKNAIIKKVTEIFDPIYLDIINESHSHNVPKGSETHFKLFIVSHVFQSQSRIQRQRLVYDLLKEEMSQSVHALSLRLLTNEEWEASRKTPAPASPPCHGGSK